MPSPQHSFWVTLGQELDSLTRKHCDRRGISLSEFARGLIARELKRPDLAAGNGRGRPRKGAEK